MSRALIVEDDADQASMVARLLRHHSIEPEIASDGATALRLVSSQVFDVVLLDVMLPDVSGFEICRRVRSDARTMLTPIVMLTALGDLDHRIGGFRVGANAYVTKPYGMEEILRAIETARDWRAELERGKICGEIHVELNSTIPFLQEVNEFLMSVSHAFPFSSDQVMQLRQSVMEMGQNAIEWGNKHNSDRLVDIVYRIHDDRVEITVRDQGPGFDRSNLPHAANADDPIAHMDVREKLGLREGGFGLMITRGMVDELRYNDVGNEVTLIKYFDSVRDLSEPPGDSACEGPV
jgi:DNA-binding response OmpR family regulator